MFNVLKPKNLCEYAAAQVSYICCTMVLGYLAAGTLFSNTTGLMNLMVLCGVIFIATYTTAINYTIELYRRKVLTGFWFMVVSITANVAYLIWSVFYA